MGRVLECKAAHWVGVAGVQPGARGLCWLLLGPDWLSLSRGTVHPLPATRAVLFQSWAEHLVAALGRTQSWVGLLYSSHLSDRQRILLTLSS